jgi:hypothetical protein
MSQWNWLSGQEVPATWCIISRVMAKAAALFVLLNVLFAVADPTAFLGRISVYNHLLPGRERLPYSENPDASFSLSLNSLEAMFASHVISVPKAENEFRVILIGDSATWGILLRPEETLAGMLNAGGYTTFGGRPMRFYNLGYPIMSLTKDLLLLDYAMVYEPDLVIWLVTLESFQWENQLSAPLAQHNPDAVRSLIEVCGLPLDVRDSEFAGRDFWGRTIVGQRRELADLLRLQLYGFTWAATGIDQVYPESYMPRQDDFEADVSFGEFTAPQELTDADLAFDILRAGIVRAESVPLVIINEPMFVSSGLNSAIRYNFFYPRWAYDAYRRLLHDIAVSESWQLLDLWNAVDMGEFTDSAVHFTPVGAMQLRDRIAPAVMSVADTGSLPS